MIGGGRRGRAWIWAAAFLFAGCFSYVPAEPGTVPPGQDVRVHFTRDAVAADLASISNQGDLMVDGRLVRGDRDQLIVRVPVAMQAAGNVTRTLGQDVTIPASRIAQLERREFNRPRTWLAFGGGVAALVAVILAFGDGVPNPELPPRREPEEFRTAGWVLSLFSVGVR
jgi:hypothetical protein